MFTSRISLTFLCSHNSRSQQSRVRGQLSSPFTFVLINLSFIGSGSTDQILDAFRLCLIVQSSVRYAEKIISFFLFVI
jgi:hypothetical protein